MNIERIEADIKTARNNISSQGNPTNDEYMYDISAYHTQQAVEKELKFILHNYYKVDDTQRSFRTHNISTLLIMVNQNDNTFIANHSDLVNISDKLTEWEASTRYGENLVAVKSEICNALDIADTLLKEIKTKYIPVEKPIETLNEDNKDFDDALGTEDVDFE